MLPPSPHPAGHAYRWLTVDTLLTVPARELPEAPADIAGRLENALAPWMPRRRVQCQLTNCARRPRPGMNGGGSLRSPRLDWRARRASWRLPPRAAGTTRCSPWGLALGRYVFHGVLSASAFEKAALAACEANGLLQEDGRLAVLATLHKGIARAKGDALPNARRTEGRVMYMNGHALHADASQIAVPEPAHIDWPDLTEKGGAKGRSQANIARLPRSHRR